MLAWLRRLRHPVGAAFAVLAFIVGVLGLSLPQWRSWLLAHALFGWVCGLALVLIVITGYLYLDQQLVNAMSDRDTVAAQLQQVQADLRLATAAPSPNDRRLFEMWRSEFPDDGDWRYDVRFFNPKWFTNRVTEPMHRLAYGVWSGRHFTSPELEQAFRRVVEAAEAFEEANGMVSYQVKTTDDEPPIAFYSITRFSAENGGESRYSKELAKNQDLALAVSTAIDEFEAIARECQF